MTAEPHRRDPTTPFSDVADWLTEELAQELFAARQDLADAAQDVPGCAAEADTLREVLLLIIRRLHDVALVLRTCDAAPSVPLEEIQRLTERIAQDCRAAQASMARGRRLLDRHADEVGTTTPGASSRIGDPRLVALRCGPPALGPRPASARRASSRRRAC